MSKTKHWCREIGLMDWCDHPACSGVDVEAIRRNAEPAPAPGYSYDPVTQIHAQVDGNAVPWSTCRTPRGAIEGFWGCIPCAGDAVKLSASQSSPRDAVNVCDHPTADPIGHRDSTEAFRWAAAEAMQRSQPSPREALVEEVENTVSYNLLAVGTIAVDTVVARIVEHLRERSRVCNESNGRETLFFGYAATDIEREFGPKGGG